MADGRVPDEVGRHAYDRIATAYGQRKAAAPLADWSQALQSTLLSGVRPGGTVLDLGCGHGFEVEDVRAAGLDAVGIDLSWGMLRAAQQRARGRVVQGDLTRLPVATGRVSAVWSLHALLHVADLQGALCEVARVLEPGGTAALTFAVGDGVTDEPVAWLPEVQRRFVHVPLPVVRQALDRAGLLVRRQGLEPGARTTCWVLAGPA